MATGKKAAWAGSPASKTDTKSKDEAERARVAGEINRIFDKTKTDVEAILNGLDAKVTAEFDKGEAEARREFTAQAQDRHGAPTRTSATRACIGVGRWTE